MLTAAAAFDCPIVPLYVTLSVPPLTRKVAPLAPANEPLPKLEVPVTFVRLTALVPVGALADELMAKKLALSAIALATIAGPPAVVLFIEPVPFVTVMAPPVVAFNAMPLLRWIDSEL